MVANKLSSPIASYVMVSHRHARLVTYIPTTEQDVEVYAIQSAPSSVSHKHTFYNIFFVHIFLRKLLVAGYSCGCVLFQIDNFSEVV